jgi:hypothetical protein
MLCLLLIMFRCPATDQHTNLSHNPAAVAGDLTPARISPSANLDSVFAPHFKLPYFTSEFRHADIQFLKQTLRCLMFCWPCIIVYQYNETNVMNFSFNLLRIKGLYMFRALLARPQEALHKRHLVYCVCVMSVGYTLVQPTDITRTQYTKCRLWRASWGRASNARNM